MSHQMRYRSASHLTLSVFIVVRITFVSTASCVPHPHRSGVITTPLDVLKTRLMTQGASGRYKNLFDATVTIARTEGLGAFMSGWQPRLIWISLGGFVFFPVLEAAKKYYAPN